MWLRECHCGSDYVIVVMYESHDTVLEIMSVWSRACHCGSDHVGAVISVWSHACHCDSDNVGVAMCMSL